MIEKGNLNEVIKSALMEEADKIDVNMDSSSSIQRTLKETYEKNFMSTLKGKFEDYRVAFRFNTRKTLTSLLCSLLLVTCLCAFSVPQVRAAALDTVKSYIYLPIKNSVGEFIVQKMPSDKVISKITVKRTETTLSDEEISKELGYTVKIPSSITDKYVLSGRWLLTGFETPKNSFTAGIYKPTAGSDKAKFILYITNSKSKDYKNIREIANSKEGSRNQKEIKINNKPAFYYESGIFKGLEDIEKGGKVSENFYNEPHDILTSHTINWEQDGIGYSLTDNGNGLSMEDMITIVSEITKRK